MKTAPKLSLFATLLAVAACNGPAPSSFVLRAPATVQAAPGAPVYVDVVIDHGEHTGAVALSAEAPQGFAASVTPDSATDSARLRVDVPGATSPGKYELKLAGSAAD